MLKRAIDWVLGLIWARASAEREPFWSVSKGVRNQFFLILSVFWIAALSLSVYLTLNCAEEMGQPCPATQSVPSVIYGVLERFSKIALGATVAAAMVTPPLVFTGDVIVGIYEAISERWGKAATERRVAEAIEEAVAKAVAETQVTARAEGYAKGVADERARQETQLQQQNREDNNQ